MGKTLTESSTANLAIPATDPEALLRAQHACVEAAKAWSNTNTPRATALMQLVSAMALSERATGRNLAPHPRAFLEALRRPLTGTLGPDAPPVALLDSDGAYSDEAMELEDELGANPIAEDTENRILKAMDAFSRQDDGAEAYRAFRRFLITTPMASSGNIVRALRPAGLNATDVYGDAPPSRYVERYNAKRERDEHLAYPCPTCGYPMRISGERVHCTARRCSQAGAQYLLHEHELRSLGGAPEVEPVLLRNQVVLLEPFWRYVLIPGLTELELAEDLEALGATVTLWPYLDAYDLLVEAGELRLRLDVKDWRSTPALIQHLRRRARPGDGTIYVLPAEQDDTLPRFHRSLRGIDVLTTTRVLQRVREARRG